MPQQDKLMRQNEEIALRLQEAADILESQEANPFRIKAYRNAATTIASLPRRVGELVEEGGIDALIALPGIGKGIAAAIHEMLWTGTWAQLERMRDTLDPVHLFQTVPGIGPELAERIHEDLHVDSLEALETAAFDGRLAELSGIGARRLRSIQATLASMLEHRRSRRARGTSTGPSIALLLEVDRDYRERARAGTLKKIAPKRFNPSGEAWLPVLHLERGGWHFNVLYSNTALAHRLGRTEDWVVIYFYDHDHFEGQHTVVTETSGRLAGERVVRGREAECLTHYHVKPGASARRRSG